MSLRKQRQPPHYLCGATPSLWRELRQRYGDVDPQFRSKARLIQLGIWSMAPERWWESWRFGRAIEQTELHPAPVFIVGHWQSGHSPMHHLMANDPQFATTRLLHVALPSCFATAEPFARFLLRRKKDMHRYVDSMPLWLDGPQGDDMAMGNLTELSYYHGYTFPRSYEAIFRRTVLFEGVTADELTEWKRCYRWLCQKIAWHSGRSRVLSRNAAHTGRIPQLLELFPQAKFIHLHRNPYRAFAGQIEKWDNLSRVWALQTPNVDQLVAETVRLYPVLMQKFLADRALIPAGQLAEVSYEELLANPVGTLHRVYSELSLPGIETLEPHLQAYVTNSKGRLAGHEIALTTEQQELVRREWGFAFEALGYSRDPAQTTEPTVSSVDD